MVGLQGAAREPGEGLSARYGAVRARSEALARPLTPEDQVVQSMTDASPTKWHLAHTTWFFEEFLLAPGAAGYKRFHPDYAYLFNSYYDAVGARHARPLRGMLTRPPLAEVMAYRAHVDAAMGAFIAAGADPATRALITLGLNHEQQHQELLLTDILHAFSCNPTSPAYAEPAGAEPAYAEPVDAEPAPLAWTGFDGGLHEIGWAGEGFAFDNEGPRHKVHVEPFALANRLVTNAEWLAFMADGGYQTPLLWLSDGWARAREEGWRAPLYWRRVGDGWAQFSLAGLRPVAADAPVVHVSFYEADAYARWAGQRLAREAEWEIAAAPRAWEGNFCDTGALRPLPAAGKGGLEQLFGDVWEWTGTPYGPYPGFRAAPGAVGEYNGKFMCNQMVLRGGSCVTAGGHLRATYRNFFYPHQRWQFAGVRLARDA